MSQLLHDFPSRGSAPPFDSLNDQPPIARKRAGVDIPFSPITRPGNRTNGLLDHHGRAVREPRGQAPSLNHRRVHNHYHPYSRYPPPHGHPEPYCRRDEENEGAQEEKMLVAGGPSGHADETTAKKRSGSTKMDDDASFSAGSAPTEGHPQPHRRKKFQHSPGTVTVGDNANDKQGEFFAIHFPFRGIM